MEQALREDSMERKIFGLREKTAEHFRFEDVDSIAIADALRTSSTLKKLHLYVTTIGKEGSQHLAEALKVNGFLEELAIVENGIGDAGAFYFADTLRWNRALTKLVLAFDTISNDGAQYLSQGLFHNKTLTRLTLRGNKISCVGVSYLAAALRANDHLTELHLNSNEVGDGGASQLALALKDNETLLKLDLSDNAIGSVGASKLAEALIFNHTLGVLHLSANKIGDSGIRLLAKALKSNESLMVLHICFNKFRDEAVRYLIEMLKFNNTLVELDIYGKEISRKRIDLITKRVNANKSVKEKLFLSTLKGDQKAPWNRCRLMFVGQGKAGKSSTVRSLLNLSFNKAWDSTIGTNVSETVQIFESESKRQSWKEVSNEPKRRSLHFAARIMLESSQPKNSTGLSENLEAFYDQDYSALQEKARAMRSTIASKQPKRRKRRKISEHFYTRFNKSNTIAEDSSYDFNEGLLIETNANSDALSLLLYDFGGQKVFYSMHNIFLTKSGVYMLVFDMRRALSAKTRKETLSYISFWSGSIRLYSPAAPVFLIGTFLEDVETNLSIVQLDLILRKEILSSIPQICLNENAKLIFYPIDNKSSRGIEDLRIAIQRTVRNETHVKQQVSMKWMMFLDELIPQRCEKTDNYLHLSSVRTIAKSVGIVDQREQDDALQLFHEHGIVLHLTSTEAMKDIVVLNPQWLIDKLSRVIRDDELHQYDCEEFERVGLKEDLIMTYKNGLTTRDFMEYVWNNENVDFLIDLMHHSMLLSEWRFGTDHYLIPSLLKDKFEGECIKGPEYLQSIFDFSGNFLPLGVFQRLLCLCVSGMCRESKGKLQEPKLFSNFASIQIDSNGSAIHLKENRELQHITVWQKRDASATILQSILSLFRKLNHNVMHSRLVWKTLLELPESTNKTNKYVSYDEARRHKLEPWFKRVNEEDVIDLHAFLEKLYI